MLIVSVNEVIKEFGIRSIPTTKNIDGETIPDTEIIEVSLEEAQLEVFGYLRNVGIDIQNLSNETITEIRRHVLNICRYKFNSRVAGSLKPDNDIMISYEKTIEFLKSVSKGVIVLSSTKSKKSGFRQIRVEVY